ncbi:cation efflux family protein [Colletotrichum higginsianum]|nr:cation efflux family protein [Colletotrichum higginsianum]
MSLAGEEALTNASSTALETPPHPPASSQAEKSEALARHSTAAAAAADVEDHLCLRSESNPYGLSFAFKNPEELVCFKANTLREINSVGNSFGSSGSAWHRSNKIQKSYKPQRSYKTQNAAIKRMLKPVDELVAEARQETSDNQPQFRVAVWGSFGLNIVLTVLQIYAAISTGSLSLITTMADAILDSLSNLTLILADRAMKCVNPRRFPAGKARLETVGNIVFCFFMISVSLVIIAFAARELVSQPMKKGTETFRIEPIVIVCVAFASKLVLYLFCFSLRNRYSHVRILWSDHRNDLLVNGFGILTSVGIWLLSAIAEFTLLASVTASVETQQLITYVCLTHSFVIQGIDTVCVYHSGPRLTAEVNIVMDPENILAETHDVAEALQIKLESLSHAERACVHVDYETTHKPEHAFRKNL